MFIRSLSKFALAALALVLSGCDGGVLDPKGHVGVQEKELIIIATVLMLLVVIPVIFMTLYFAWKYREGRDEVYMPKWAHSTKIESVVWTIPIIIIIILGTITWKTTHELDPYRPLEGADGKQLDHMVVEVVSLNWKWLFIYPEQGVATVNELVFPKDVPVQFKITSDSTMNSFFIPQLGSQIYSMAGMETKLHLIANHEGTYDGFSANYSGAGFTGMKFKAIATATDADFNSWVAKVKASGTPLNPQSYEVLAEESENNPVQYYSDVTDGLFHQIVMKYMQHYNDWGKGGNEHGEGMKHGEHHDAEASDMPKMQHSADHAAAHGEA